MGIDPFFLFYFYFIFILFLFYFYFISILFLKFICVIFVNKCAGATTRRSNEYCEIRDAIGVHYRLADYLGR